MPTPEQVLEDLGRIANDWRFLAILWHAFFGVLALGLVSGVRPSKRTVGIILALPLLSVSVLAWVTRNPFNGTLFALAALGLVGISRRLMSEPVQMFPLWSAVIGAPVFMFGWIYPHFLETSSFVAYTYAAPTGLIPCPTLSIVIGVSLILGGLGSRSWSLVAGVTGVFYGLFGALRLGVMIDWVLVAGGLAILLLAAFGNNDARLKEPAPCT